MGAALPKNRTTVRTQNRPTVGLRAARAGLRLLSPSPDLAARYAERLFLTARRHRRPAWEAELLLGSRAMLVPHGDALLPAWSWGSGPDVVLLVHGWEGRGAQLGAFVEPLVAAGLRVVTFDAPGHGDAPAGPTSVVEHARAVATVARFLEARMGRVHAVIGHSVGGAATVLATKLGLDAQRLVLIAPPTSPERFAKGFGRMLGMSPEVWQRMIARVEERYGVTMGDLDVPTQAALVRAPLLVVHDTSDDVVPHGDGAAIAAAAPNGSIVTTEGLGHRRVLRAPAVVEAVTSFVTEGRSGGPSEFAATIDGELFYRDRRW
ncbi:MAG: alpha/beta hydrolase [Deltaproteobacteria bacterium]|nr:alpha/beta hydrolase [Deltaproteobacteria bacterium]